MRDDQFSLNKWLRLRDALALACRKRDRRNAKQEICDLAIARKIVLRGELNAKYVFFDNDSYCAYLVLSNIDWRGGRLFQFVELYRSPGNLRVLNDDVFQAFVDGRSSPNPKPPEAANPRPAQYARSRGGRPEKFSWDEIWIETCRYIHDNGIPPTAAELMKHLQQWCENHFDKQPADSTLKPKLGKLYAVLRRQDEN
jgi:hypothetical protein